MMSNKTDTKHSPHAVRLESGKSTTKSLHVVFSGNGGWVVKREGTARASKRFDNQHEAISWATEAAKKKAMGELVVHGRDGMIKKKEIYGVDPHPSHG